MPQRTRFALVLLGLATASLACAPAPTDPTALKAGAPTPRVTLRAGDSQPEGRPSTRFLHDFADEVNRRSHGALHISVETDASRAGAGDDRPMIADLDSGRLDIATVPTRAWAEAGFTEFWVLQAPFEFTSIEAMDAVASDRRVVAQLTARLEGRGFHTLSVYGESLRYLFSVGPPILAPSDLRNTTVWSITPGMAEMLAPVGARVVRLSDGEILDALNARRLDAFESDLTRAASSDIYVGSVVAADVPVSAKFQSLVVGPAAWQRLRQDERAILEEAAEAARNRLRASAPDAATQAALFCTSGGAVVTAGAARLSAFREALTPWAVAVDDGMLANVRAITAGVGTPTPPEQCDGRPPAIPRDSGASDGFPDGVYRLEWDGDFASRWNDEHTAPGAITFNSHDLAGLPAVVTWTLHRGTYTFEIQFRGESPLVVHGGRYSVEGDELTITLLPDVGNTTNVVRFHVAPDGTVTFDQIDGRALDPYYAVPWVRIGDE